MLNFWYKKLNKKGFTLAELLIVIAIIVILVGIAIPAFTSTLEKARKATDQANLRGVASEYMTWALTNEVYSGGVVPPPKLTVSADGKSVDIEDPGTSIGDPPVAVTRTPSDASFTKVTVELKYYTTIAASNTAPTANSKTANWTTEKNTFLFD